MDPIVVAKSKRGGTTHPKFGALTEGEIYQMALHEFGGELFVPQELVIYGKQYTIEKVADPVGVILGGQAYRLRLSPPSPAEKKEG